MTTIYPFVLFGKKNGSGAMPSSAWTLTVRDIINDVELVTAQTMTAVTGMTGWYKYLYTGADNLLLIGNAITADLTMDESGLGLTPEISHIVLGISGRLPTGLDANGYIKAGMRGILDTGLTETVTGYLAAALKKLLDVATPVFTAASVNQTGDNFPKTTNLPSNPASQTNLDTTISSRLATSGYTAPDNADIVLIKAKTDNLPSDPADQSLLMAEIDTRATPADVTVSLTVSAAQAAAASTGHLAIVAGSTYRTTLSSTYAGDLSAATEMWAAWKSDKSLLDSASTIYITKTGGLTTLNGAPIVSPVISGHGSVAVTGTAGAWVIAVYLDEIATAQLFGLNAAYAVGVGARVGSDKDVIWSMDTGNTIVDGVIRAT